MKYVVVLLIFGWTLPSFAGFEPNVPGARSIGMGGVSVSILSNEWAVIANPGLLYSLRERSVSVSFSPQPFGLKELTRGVLSYIEPTSIGTLGFSASRYGFDLYHEISLSLSFGGSVSEAFQYGLTLAYYSLAIQNYGSDWTVGATLGWAIHITDDVCWGFVALNVNSPTIGAAKENLPQMYSTGLSYTPLGEVTLGIEIVKDIRFPTEFHVGLEYDILDVLTVRGGLASDPGTMNGGVGIHYSFVKFDYAFSSHVDLGTTHELSLSVLLGAL